MIVTTPDEELEDELELLEEELEDELELLEDDELELELLEDDELELELPEEDEPFIQSEGSIDSALC